MYSSTSSVPFPFETYEQTSPSAFADLNTSTAHSLVMSGSL